MMGVASLQLPAKYMQFFSLSDCPNLRPFFFFMRDKLLAISIERFAQWVSSYTMYWFLCLSLASVPSNRKVCNLSSQIA